MLVGPVPRSEFSSAEEPTSDTMTHELASSYPAPELHRAVATTRNGIMTWTRYYDGVELDLQPVTSRSSPTSWVTRFKPELASPARVDRAKLIGDAAAEQASKLTGGTATLRYVGQLALRQLPGTKGNNAMDFVQVVESWRLAYRIDNQSASADVDAYTGEHIRTWSHYIN
jgi:hypothetical protein